jgi:SAM-dependent methyltransferase
LNPDLTNFTAQEEFLDNPMPDVIQQWWFYLSVLNPQAGDLVLDVGCNTGDAERLLMREYPYIEKVIGLENYLASAKRPGFRAFAPWSIRSSTPTGCQHFMAIKQRT